MRKLLVLAAILFMTPIAIGMTMSLNDTGTTVELGVFMAEEGDIHIIAMVIEAPGVLSNFVAGPEAPLMFPGWNGTINGDSGQGFAIGQTPPFDDGVWLIADWSASVPVWVSAYKGIHTGGEYNWDLMDQIQVPEPMTIALLGLGGIFILRRRRR